MGLRKDNMEKISVRKANYQASREIIMAEYPACVHLYMASLCMVPLPLYPQQTGRARTRKFIICTTPLSC